jgi:16S rRNA processing protein RimM
MTSPEFAIVGRVRKAHGIRGEIVVEPITDEPEAVFASGRRLFAGTTATELPPGAREVRVTRSTPFKGGMIVALDAIGDRNEAELWRERFLFAPLAELAPLADDEVYLHDLIGMRVVLVTGDAVGDVDAVYEMPQGPMLDVRRPADTVLLPYRAEVVRSVDLAARTIVVDPPEGMLE